MYLSLRSDAVCHSFRLLCATTLAVQLACYTSILPRDAVPDNLGGIATRAIEMWLGTELSR
jgi:hypothetical protein